MAETTSQIDPALLPFLQTGLQRAEQLFLTGPQPTFFPGQTYVSPSAQTLGALSQQEALASAPSQVLSEAQRSFLSGMTTPSAATPLYQNIYGAAGFQPGVPVYQQAAMGGFVNPALGMTAQTAGGGFLQGSPYQQAMIAAATRPLVQQYAETTLPGIASGFSRAGRYGSGAMEQAQGRATEAFGRALGDVTSTIAGQDYARERGFQEAARQQLAALGQQDVANRLLGAGGLQQAQQTALAAQLQAAGGVGATQAQELQRQLAAAQLAPSIYQQQFLPSQALAAVGAGQEAIARQPLQEQMARFTFEQQAPRESLMSFLSSVYGNPLRAYGTQTIPQAQTNPLGSALGGATLGYLGGSFLTNQFGQNAPLYGAGLGGLLGYFG